MKKTLLAGLLLAFAIGAGPAAAQNVQMAPARPAPSIDQADTFLGLCQKPESHDVCVMYFAGFTNGALVQSLIDKQRPRYCAPQNVGRSEQLVAVIAWMRVNPQDLLGSTAAALYKALIGTYPCR